MKQIQIGAREVGPDRPTFVIAEIGVNHNGDPQQARELVRQAIEAGVDAVKFQKRSLHDLYCRDVLEHTADYEQPYQYLIPILQRVELPETVLAGLAREVRGAGLEFLCTPFDPASVEVVRRLGVNAWKVASADLTNLPLLECLCDDGRPLILSTGMCRAEEIARTVEFLRARAARFALLHCVSTYPAHVGDVNLRAMDSLAAHGVPVGYSGHELELGVALAAVARGACILEKHLTLDRRQDGPDHRASLLPDEFKRLVAEVRHVEAALGSPSKQIRQGELINRELLGKGLVAARDLPAGTLLGPGMLVVKSPARGISPQKLEQVQGKRLLRDLAADDPLTERDLDGRRRGFVPHAGLGRWGVVVRPSDLDQLSDLDPPVYEFHLTQEDLDRPFPRRSFRQELVVHAPEYHQGRLMDLVSPDESLRRRAVAVLRKVGERVRQMAPYFQGEPRIVVHPGGASTDQRNGATDYALRFARSLDEARLDGMLVLPENLPPYPWYFGGKWYTHFFAGAEEIASFCERYGYRLCLDLSHAQLYCKAAGRSLAGYVRRLRPLVEHLHISDAAGTDGEGLQIGEGEIDFPRVLAELAPFEGSWIPEIWRGHQHGGAGFREALARLAELFPREASATLSGGKEKRWA